MTNGGITEGHTEYSGCSDLSPATLFLAGAGWVFSGHDAHARVVDVAQRLPSDLFGGGKTRCNMHNCIIARLREGSGELARLALPTPIFFVVLFLLAIAAQCIAQDETYSFVSRNVITGETVSVSGYSEKPYCPPQIEYLREQTAKIRAEIEASRMKQLEYEQLQELEEQTELLRKIANQ